jgi:beta-glucosidase
MRSWAVLTGSCLGLFEHPYADENGIDLQNEVTRQVARRWRRNRSLLENNGILPWGGKPRGGRADGRRSAGVAQRLQFPGASDHQRYGEETSRTTPRAALEHYLGASERALRQRVSHHRKTDGGCAGLLPGDSGGKPMQQSPYRKAPP